MPLNYVREYWISYHNRNSIKLITIIAYEYARKSFVLLFVVVELALSPILHYQFDIDPKLAYMITWVTSNPRVVPQ